MGSTGPARGAPLNEDGPTLASRALSAPTLYWIVGVILGYYASERMSWDSGETYWESALKWHNLPLFVMLAAICSIAEFLYRRDRFPALRSAALAPFIIVQLRFALWLLYYQHILLILGFASAIALTLASIKFARPHAVARLG
jgi:hypothetical protein